MAATATSLRPPAVVQELIARLQASTSFDQGVTLIRWGLLAKLPTEKERVYLLGVTDYVLGPASRGHHIRREDFNLRGLIEVQQYGTGGPEQVGSRAWELLSAVDTEIRDEFGLDCGVRYSGRLSVAADEVVPATDGWLARVLFSLALEGVQ